MRNNRATSQARKRRSNRKHRLNRRQRRNLKRFQNSSSPRPLVSQEEAIHQNSKFGVPTREQSSRLTACQEKLFFDYCDANSPHSGIKCSCKIRRLACRDGVNSRSYTRTQKEADAWRAAKAEEEQLIFQKIREFYAAKEKSDREFVLNCEFKPIGSGPILKPKVLPIVERVLSELTWDYHSLCDCMDSILLACDMEDEFECNST